MSDFILSDNSNFHVALIEGGGDACAREAMCFVTQKFVRQSDYLQDRRKKPVLSRPCPARGGQ